MSQDVAFGVEATKLRLFLSAEQLFAEFGIEAVSSRQIALAAGQKNASAISYHFGTKDDLVGALLRLRVDEINLMREELIASSGPDPDAASLIAMIVIPLANKVMRDSSGAAYIGFLANLFWDRSRRDRWIDQAESGALLRDIYARLRRRCPSMPANLWEVRLRQMLGGVISALADRERHRGAERRKLIELSDAAFVSNLVDIGVATLTALPSATTLAALTPNEH